MANNGLEGCPCIDVSANLASVNLPSCNTATNNETGIQLLPGGACFPHSWGSSQCLQHDLVHDPACSLDQAGKAVIPSKLYSLFLHFRFGVLVQQHHQKKFTHLIFLLLCCSGYCFRPWCYVDVDKCKRDSDERVFRSDYLPDVSAQANLNHDNMI